MLTRAELIKVNKEYRSKDESHLWPIRGRFNVTNRAIRQAYVLRCSIGEHGSELEYRLTLEDLISRIVNNSKNW